MAKELPADSISGQSSVRCIGSDWGNIRVTLSAKILVVDDETNERNGLAELLTGWGYQTESAADGEEALEKISAFNPEVVISDLRMPRMGGMDLLKRLHEENPAASFIILTGQGTIEEAVEATKLGAYNFLEKPVDAKRLRIELRNCLERNENKQSLEIAQRKLLSLIHI